MLPIKRNGLNGSFRNTLTDLKGATFVILKNHASALVRKAKQGGRPAKIRLWKRAGCQSKALEKSIVARIIREPGLGLLNPSEMN